MRASATADSSILRNVICKDKGMILLLGCGNHKTHSDDYGRVNRLTLQLSAALRGCNRVGCSPNGIY